MRTEESKRDVDEAGFEQIGGVAQWVQIRGADRDNAVLLVLPAHTSSTIVPDQYRAWERDFTVVEWDRRTAGRTLARNGKAGSEAWSLALLAADGLELVDLICRRLACDKIVLFAHSQ